MSYWTGTEWAPEPQAPVKRPSRIRDAFEAILEGGLVAALAVGLLAGTTFAGRNTGVITVPDGQFGGTTTATVNPGGSGTWARARCYQHGSLVYTEYVYAGADNRATFTLGPTASWTGGGASCTADEGVFGNNERWRTLASTTFDVAP